MVVPVLNEEGSLEDTLRSLRAQTFTDFELLVVDNGSTDRSREIAAEFADRVVEETVRGPDLARHRGFLEARTELLASADADTVYPPTWLERLVGTLDRPGVVAVYGTMGFRESLRWLRAVEARAFAALLWVSHGLGVPFAGAANSGCRRSAYLQVGGYPPYAHLACADVRLARALRRVGRVAFNPRLTAYTSNRTLALQGPVAAVARFVLIWLDIAFDRNRVPPGHYLAQRERRGRWGLEGDEGRDLH